MHAGLSIGKHFRFDWSYGVIATLLLQHSTTISPDLRGVVFWLCICASKLWTAARAAELVRLSIFSHVVQSAATPVQRHSYSNSHRRPRLFKTFDTSASSVGSVGEGFGGGGSVAGELTSVSLGAAFFLFLRCLARAPPFDPPPALPGGAAFSTATTHVGTTTGAAFPVGSAIGL